MIYGTDHKLDGNEALVLTKPKRQNRVYRYPFHRLESGEWILVKERDWYTRHALRYVRANLDGELVERHVPASQSRLTDYTDGGGVQTPASSAEACGD